MNTRYCFLWFLVTVILLVAAIPVAANTTCDTTANEMAKGQQSLQTADYETALAAFTCAIEADSTQYQPFLGRIQANLLAGYYVNALEDYLFVRARIYHPPNHSLFRDMIAPYNEDLKAAPDDKEQLTMRSFMYWCDLDNFKALKDLNHLLEVDPQNVYGNLLQGAIYVAIGSLDKASEDFSRALEQDSENPQLLFLIAYVYGSYGQDNHDKKAFEQTTDYLNQAVELGFDDPLRYRLQAFIDTGIGTPEQAAADYLKHMNAVSPEIIELGGLTVDEASSFSIAPHQTYQFTLEAQAGHQLFISARGIPHTLDTFIVLLDPHGNPVTSNDDVDTPDSLIDGYQVSESGTYTLLVSTILGYGDGDGAVIFSSK